MDAVLLQIPALHDVELELVRLEGRESISSPGCYDLEFTTPSGTVPSLVGERVALRLESVRVGADLQRNIFGDVTSSSIDDHLLGSSHLTRLRIESSSWRLRRRTNSRVFQDQSIPQILETLLSEHDISFVSRLDDSQYPGRDYAVQYDETDASFVERLLGECGLFYFHDRNGQLVLCDSASSYLHDGPALHYRPDAERSDLQTRSEHAAFSIRQAQHVRSRTVVARRYDDLRAASSFEATSSVQGGTQLDTPLASLSDSDARLRTEVDVDAIYIHRAAPVDEDAQRHSSSLLLEQHLRDERLLTITSNSDRLLVGSTFELRDYPLFGPGDRFTPVHISFSYGADADGAQLFECTCDSVPAAIPWRAPAPPRRTVQVLETATVVGPPGTHVHTDHLGRVKIRFHWERSTRDQVTSCWVRSLQPWAGAGYGSFFLPRVGSEVAVTFLGGDPDNPVILGGLYNSALIPPLDLPSQALRSGFYSASIDPATGSLGGGTSHVTIDDTLDNELLSLKAQRDLSVQVGQKWTAAMAERQVHVTGNDSTTILGDINAVTGGNYDATVSGRWSLNVDGSSTLSVKGSRRESYSTDLSREAANSTDIFSSHSLHTRRYSFSAIDDQASVFLGANTGDLDVSASQDVTITAAASIRLTVGTTTLVLEENRLRLEAENLELRGNSSSRITGSEASVALGGGISLGGSSLSLASSGASLVLDADAHLDGGLVLLNCGSSGESGALGEVPSRDQRTLRLQLHHPNGLPITNWPFVLTAGTQRIAGSTDPLGMVTVALDAEVQQAVLVATHPSDPDDQVRWTIAIEPLPPLPTLEGLRMRLQNLGFFPPSEEDVHDELHQLDSSALASTSSSKEEVELRAALRAFQDAFDLAPTGELDQPTLAKLRGLSATPATR